MDRRRYLVACAAGLGAVAGCAGGADDGGAGTATDPPATVRARETDAYGPILVDADGMTLYRFTADDGADGSACSGGCAENWPPLAVPAGTSPTAGPDVPGSLDTVAREDGTRQVTHDGWPLYGFAPDAAPGDVSGQGVGDAWFVVPAGPTRAVVATPNGDHGEILTDARGRTLYRFTADVGADGSACTGGCASAWPPLTADDPTAHGGLGDRLGSIQRADGSTQVTYGGWPLYYYADDALAGQTRGQGAGDAWYVLGRDVAEMGADARTTTEPMDPTAADTTETSTAADGTTTEYTTQSGGTY